MEEGPENHGENVKTPAKRATIAAAHRAERARRRAMTSFAEQEITAELAAFPHPAPSEQKENNE